MDNIAIQEDELVAAEWQSLAEFEANPFPKSIPLLGKVSCRSITRSNISAPHAFSSLRIAVTMPKMRLFKRLAI